MAKSPPRVFISYAHEPENKAHADGVLALAHKLRQQGVDAWIDQFEQFPPKGWRPWMTEQILKADWVLIVCTEEYQRRFEGNAPAKLGRGVGWESQHITQQLYDAKFNNTRFVPVLPPEGDEQFIPLPLKDYRKFQLDGEYEALYRLLTGQPATPARNLGEIRRLPPLAVPGAGEDVPAPDVAARPRDIRNPYPGLAAFKPENQRFYFGREEDTARVIKRLNETRLVSVVGGSGTGKSSLVAAGVVPALQENSPELAYVRFKPQADPFRELAEALDGALQEERVELGPPRADRIRAQLESDPTGAVQGYLGKVGPRILLFADQFEELFTQTPPDTAKRFRGVIGPLLQRESLSLVLTLRSEFMHRLMEWLGSDLFAKSLVPLDPIEDEDRLRTIIVRPAQECGVPVQPALLSKLLAAAVTTCSGAGSGRSQPWRRCSPSATALPRTTLGSPTRAFTHGAPWRPRWTSRCAASSCPSPCGCWKS